MKLWVDADAAPKDVKDIVMRAAERLGIEAVMVANQRLFVAPGHKFVTSLRVAGGPDAADDHIAEHAEAGDVAVTADVPLAARLVAKRVTVLDPRGEELTAENVGERLSVRDFMEGLRGAGVVTGGPAAYGAREKQAFARALDRALARAKRAADR
ncbi:MAG: YaiI/YqxD family protein [Gemmatimonadaceae bacterium]